MTKDVLVSIAGLQMAVNDVEGEQDDPIEIVSPGTYYFKDGKHYIFFEEVAEGVAGITKTQIKITEKDILEVTKRGVSNMHMLFEKNRSTRCYYQTPYGRLNLGISTSSISIDEQEDNINVKAEYSMDVDFEPLAECVIRINIKPRDSKDFSIRDEMTF